MFLYKRSFTSGRLSVKRQINGISDTEGRAMLRGNEHKRGFIDQRSISVKGKKRGWKKEVNRRKNYRRSFNAEGTGQSRFFWFSSL